MLNIKFISIFAASGFIFSFLIGLFSKSKFYIILLRALIFGIIFGLIALLISYLYNKFLNDEAGSDFTPDTSSSSNTVNTDTKGQKVDFVIQDEEFARSESENHFLVGENHQMLNNTDISSANKKENENIASNGTENSLGSVSNDAEKFVPLKNFENVSNFSSREAVPSSVVNSENQEVKPLFNETSETRNGNDFGDNIDTLPDMNTFSFNGESEKSSVEGGVIEESDDTFGSSVSTDKKSEYSGEVKDASLMAKAISSILSGENS